MFERNHNNPAPFTTYPRHSRAARCVLSIIRPAKHHTAATFEHSTDCTCCDFGHLRFYLLRDERSAIINQHKFVHYLHLAGVYFTFCRCLFQNLQVSISKFAGVYFKFCRCLFQILQVSILNFAGVHFKFCRCLFQILQVSISNFEGVHFKFAHHNFVGA
jgi:hypothetical protein